MEKYIYLVISIAAITLGAALSIYGICTDRLYLCGEGFIYALVGSFLFSNYKESKERESDVI
jgi:threonine aldolase